MLAITLDQTIAVVIGCLYAALWLFIWRKEKR